MQSRTRAMCITAMFAVLMAIGAWIALPSAPPFTMQTFVLYCMIWLLDGPKMLGAVLLYVLLGAVGVPVFAGFQGGIGILFGATGGYVVGFVLTALLCCLLPRSKHSAAVSIAIAVSGTLVCYLLATMWYAYIYTGFTAAGLWTAAVTCVLPFVLPDLCKGVLAALVCKRLKPRLHGHL